MEIETLMKIQKILSQEGYAAHICEDCVAVLDPILIHGKAYNCRVYHIYSEERAYKFIEEREAE